jgi:hypothetical protein
LQYGDLEEKIGDVPDEFLSQIREWEREIKDIVFNTKMRVMQQYARAPYVECDADRKVFALWVQEHCPDDKAYMFAMLDDRDIEALIYKLEWKNYQSDTDAKAG